MFEEEEQMENGMRAAVDFLNADTNVRNALINNLMQVGNDSLEDIGNELSHLMRKRGIDIKPDVLAEALSQTYEYGFQRYMGEYDNSSLSEKDIFNENVEVDARGVDNAMQRKRTISLMVDDLDCRDHHVPNCWDDFVNRGYSEIRRTIYKQLGDAAANAFEYYFNYDTRDILKFGLTQGLTRAHNLTIDELQYLNAATMKLEEQAVESKSSNRESLSSMFK